MQAIANSAAFHFAAIEQGGTSLYASLAEKVSNVFVLKVVLGIGGAEVNHFAIWHDKAGNVLPLQSLVCRFLISRVSMAIHRVKRIDHAGALSVY